MMMTYYIPHTCTIHSLNIRNQGENFRQIPLSRYRFTHSDMFKHII